MASGVQTAERPSALWSKERVCFETDLSERTFDRLRAGRKFPPPDLMVGRMPRWKPPTVQAWIESKSGKAADSRASS